MQTVQQEGLEPATAMGSGGLRRYLAGWQEWKWNSHTSS